MWWTHRCAMESRKSHIQVKICLQWLSNVAVLELITEPVSTSGRNA